ncbi:hypothetical protein MAPG_02049 [Magnaporthiopsis poae ATCC 64411]|uniref:Uncharacterized protein n=1 Tax=Magnaporthiopsis poae (strain ATCC 64411 / 73-15) TaxID=644358 RepID=A0A0C4DQB1_MAGP6|nr:hypothetical protein MAPG_02049 [Magnaporthiopsis poae ATCC 64411]
MQNDTDYFDFVVSYFYSPPSFALLTDWPGVKTASDMTAMATAPGVVYLQQQQQPQNLPGAQVPVPPADPQHGGIPFDVGYGPLPHVPLPMGFQEQQQPQQQQQFAPDMAMQWQQQQPQPQMLATTAQPQQQQTFTANGITYVANGGVPLQLQPQQQQVPVQMYPGVVGVNTAAAGGGAGYVQQLPAQGHVVGTQGMGQVQFMDGQQQQQQMMMQQPPLAQQPQQQQQQQQMVLQQAPVAQQQPQQQQQQLVMSSNGSLVRVVQPGQLPAGAKIVSPDQLPPGAVQQFSPPLTRAATVPTTSPPPMFDATPASPISAKDPAAAVLGFPPHSPYTQPATPATRSVVSPSVASPATSQQQPTPTTAMQTPQTTATSPQSLVMPAAMSPTVVAPQQIQGLALQQQQQPQQIPVAAQPQLLMNPVVQCPEQQQQQQAVWVQQGQQMVLMQIPTVTDGGGGGGQVLLPAAQPGQQQAAMPPTFAVDANGNLVLLATPSATAAVAAAGDSAATTTAAGQQQEKQQFWTKERAEKSKATAKKALKQTKNALVKTNDFLGKAVAPIMPLLAVTDPELAAASPNRTSSILISAFVPRHQLPVGRAAVESAAKSLRWLSSSPTPTPTNSNSNSIGTRRDKTAELAGTRWQHFDSYTSPGAYSAGSFRETRDLVFSADCSFAYDRVFAASVSTFDSCGNTTSDLTQHDPDHTRGEYRLFACRGVNDADGDGDGAEQLVLAEDGSLDVKVWAVQRPGPGIMVVGGKKYLKKS